MNIKTLEGPSIQSALAEARRLLGDDVMLLESVAAGETEPARVTVMVDETLAEAPRPTAPVEEPALAGAGGYGYAAPSSAERPAGGASAFSSAPRPPRPRLFAPEPAAPALDLAALEALLDARLGGLSDRLGSLEASAVLGAERAWLRHPLYGELLAEGFRPATADRLFAFAAERGFRADDRSATALTELRWAVRHALRDLLPRPTASHDAAGTLVLVGPSGAGKTSLLLKLALHPSLYGRRKTAALVLTPDDAAHLHHSPTDLFRRHGLPVQTASTPAEVRQALARTAGFDQVLVDTPPLHPDPRRARRTLAWLGELLAEVDAFDVHLVLDATRALGGFDVAALERLALRPTAASLTRLDETVGAGHTAEWLLALGLPISLRLDGAARAGRRAGVLAGLVRRAGGSRRRGGGMELIRPKGPTTLAVVSGKGGVGKSVIAVNLAEALASAGARVALVDADLGQGACAVLVNETPPTTVYECGTRGGAVAEASLRTAGGVTLVQGAAGPLTPGATASLFDDLDRVVTALRAHHDYVLIDTPAGLDGPVRWALDRADLGLLVLAGEPTAIADAYRLARLVWETDPGYALGAVVNLADTEDEARSVSERFGAITERFTGRAPEYLGWVPYAAAMRRAVKAQTPAVREPGSMRHAFGALAGALAARQPVRFPFDL